VRGREAHGAHRRGRRTAATALLLDENGEVVRPVARAASKPPARERRRGGQGSRAGADTADAPPRASRGRRAVADPEDAETRLEAGLSESPATIDGEPEQEPLEPEQAGAQDPSGEAGEDGLQSKPRRRGRRGGRRRSAAKAEAAPE